MNGLKTYMDTSILSGDGFFFKHLRNTKNYPLNVAFFNIFQKQASLRRFPYILKLASHFLVLSFNQIAVYPLQHKNAAHMCTRVISSCLHIQICSFIMCLGPTALFCFFFFSNLDRHTEILKCQTSTFLLSCNQHTMLCQFQVYNIVN